MPFSTNLQPRTKVEVGETASFTKTITETDTAVAEVLEVREDKPIVTLSTNCYNQYNAIVVEGKAVVLVDRTPAKAHL